MNIRIATAGDAKAITELAVAFRNHLQRALPADSMLLHSIQELLAAGDAEFYLAESDGQAIGSVLQRYRHSMWASGSEATIEDLYVEPGCRKTGYGRKLIEFAVQRARQLGCTTMCLDTNERNVASQKIYQSFGFTSYSQRWDGRQIFYRLNFK